jgi:hypothetical protein
MPGLDPGAVVGVRRVAGDPSLPGRIVDLRHRMEMHAKLADPVRLVGPHHRLVPHHRRHRDVEVDAGRAVERKRTHQPQPIRRSVERDLRVVAAIRRQRIGGPARLCDRCHHLRSVGRVEIRHWIESRTVDDRQRRRPRLATIRPRRRIICTRRCHHHEHHRRDRHHRQNGQPPPEEPVHDPLLPLSRLVADECASRGQRTTNAFLTRVSDGAKGRAAAYRAGVRSCCGLSAAAISCTKLAVASNGAACPAPST